MVEIFVDTTNFTKKMNAAIKKVSAFCKSAAKTDKAIKKAIKDGTKSG